MMDRRTFLNRMAIAVAWTASASLLGTGGSAEPRTGSPPDPGHKPADDRLRSLHRDSFRPNLKTRFQVHPSTGRPISMTLVRTEDLSRSQDIESFRLVFRGPRQVVLPQGTYRLDHPVMGTVGLFLVPVLTKDRGVQDYEAVFTRRVSPSRETS